MKNNQKSSKKSSLIMVAVLALLTVAIIGIVVIEQKARAGNWQYYDEYAATNQREKPEIKYTEMESSYYIPEDAASEVKKISKFYDEVKNVLRDEFQGYTGLNWDRFERTELMVVDTIDNVNGMDVNGYFNSKDEIVYIPARLQEKEDQYIKEVLCHELIHSLTVRNDSRPTTQLYEGFVEYLAQGIYFLEDYDSYYFSQQFAMLYVQRYGIQSALDKFCTDAIVDEIEEVLDRPSVIYTIEPLLEYTSIEGNFEQGAVNILLDVLAHYSAKIGADPRYLGVTITAYRMRYGDDAKYFEKILK